MSAHRPSPTAAAIRRMAERHGVTYVVTPNDRLADHIARVARAASSDAFVRSLFFFHRCFTWRLTPARF
jgi:hypothetical protein